ncbi:cytochrome P450 [Neolentinus lepideus HHB14362 ss-1]|uniref:Cytochrome P450 n=1 Tax=Neolentinus lepideus HHB14362 ss-1 TaxID=1314782 RepID=A0A165UW21_9AGAM|nr:cytochrome P450 [Neolentinus lepideus HHB14362 ss-1]
MPTKHPWKTIADWGELYGGIVYVNVLGQPLVFLNSPNTAYDMLDKKSLKRFSEEFRAMRRLFHLYMGTRSSIEQFVPIEEYEIKSFLKRVLNNPNDFGGAIRRSIGAIILKVTYSYEPKEYDDPLVELIDRAMKQVSILTTPNTFLVDVLPILKHIPAWFPGARFKRIASEWAKCASDTQGGTDTPASSVTTFFLTMMLYPEAQTKAQAEIDAMIGNDRLPSLADRDQLPYVDALVKEVFRWHPVGPFGKLSFRPATVC